MRVFVTGASGFIGTAVVRELIEAGHRVLGLARGDASAEALTRQGAEVNRGDLTDTEGLAEGARVCDGVIHLGFIHDFSNMAASLETDRLAIAAIGEALAGSGRPFVGTTGTMLLTPGRLGTEDDTASPDSAGSTRVPSEALALSFASRGVRACVVRLAPSVHGDGDRGFVPALIANAREKGVSAYVGDGSNRWPAVHRLDAARLFRLALEKGEPGARYHGVADQGEPFRDIAGTIGRRLNLPVVSVPPEKVADHFGWLGFVVGVDNPASNALTRERLGWQPAQPGLLADIDGPAYFGA